MMLKCYYCGKVFRIANRSILLINYISPIKRFCSLKCVGDYATLSVEARKKLANKKRIKKTRLVWFEVRK